MKVHLNKCDDCGELLDKARDIFHPVKCVSDRFWNGMENINIELEPIDLCRKCANNLVPTLKLLAKKKKAHGIKKSDAGVE